MMLNTSLKLSTPSSDRRVTPTTGSTDPNRVTQDTLLTTTSASSTLTKRRRHARVGWNINEHVCTTDATPRAEPLLTRNRIVFGLFTTLMTVFLFTLCWAELGYRADSRRLAVHTPMKPKAYVFKTKGKNGSILPGFRYTGREVTAIGHKSQAEALGLLAHSMITKITAGKCPDCKGECEVDGKECGSCGGAGTETTDFSENSDTKPEDILNQVKLSKEITSMSIIFNVPIHFTAKMSKRIKDKFATQYDKTKELKTDTSEKPWYKTAWGYCKKSIKKTVGAVAGGISAAIGALSPATKNTLIFYTQGGTESQPEVWCDIAQLFNWKHSGKRGHTFKQQYVPGSQAKVVGIAALEISDKTIGKKTFTIRLEGECDRVIQYNNKDNTEEDIANMLNAMRWINDKNSALFKDCNFSKLEKALDAQLSGRRLLASTCISTPLRWFTEKIGEMEELDWSPRRSRLTRY